MQNSPQLRTSLDKESLRYLNSYKAFELVLFFSANLGYTFLKGLGHEIDF